MSPPSISGPVLSSLPRGSTLFTCGNNLLVSTGNWMLDQHLGAGKRTKLDANGEIAECNTSLLRITKRRNHLCDKS